MIFGFGELSDVARVIESTLIVEGQRPPDRGRSGRNPSIADVRFAFGKTDSAINKGTFASPVSGTVSVWTSGDNFASFADTTDNITVYNFWGNVASSKQVLCVQTLWGWVLVAAEC